MRTQLLRSRPHRPQALRRRAAARHTTPRATVPEDAALYTCECGKAFTAAVTTCVTCPTCGQGQAW